MDPLNKIANKKEKLVIGLMSGTSTDGIDAVLLRVRGCGFSTRFTQLGFHTYGYPAALKNKLFSVQDSRTVTLEDIGRLHAALGEVFARAVIKLCASCKIPLQNVDIIGSHGHTIAHFPKPKKLFGYRVGTTWQIGDPGVIAQRTGIITVGDFRSADVAAGGEGAPLVPYFDFVMFRSETEHRGLLNIGGISNLTILPKKSGVEDVFAFDCGPGNMVVDHLMRELYGKNFDRDGRIAAKGAISSPLLQWLTRHPFLKKSPPRSTGREEFGPHFSKKVLQKSARLRLPKEDIIATVTAFTVQAIIVTYNRFIKPHRPVSKLIVSGGGVHNLVMMRQIADNMAETHVDSIESYGISSDSKEAIAFAVLANETIAGNPGNVPAATGAKRQVVLGKICLP